MQEVLPLRHKHSPALLQEFGGRVGSARKQHPDVTPGSAPLGRDQVMARGSLMLDAQHSMRHAASRSGWGGSVQVEVGNRAAACNAIFIFPWQVHQFELSSSQDVLPKRRKISEPKEQF